MSLNPTGTNYNWNFSNPQKDGYSETLVGTIVAIQEVQAREYNPNHNGPGAPKFWKDGNPVMNIRISLALQDGSLKTFTFAKAGKDQREGRKPSVHMQMFGLVGNTDMMNLIGKTVQITTWPANPATGQAWQRGNPRLFDIQIVPDVKYELNAPIPEELKVPELLANNGASGGQPIQQVAQQPVVPVQQPVVPVQMPTQQPVQQNTVTPMQPQIPAGMDPQVAAAMQNMGATNVSTVYDDDEIPF